MTALTGWTWTGLFLISEASLVICVNSFYPSLCVGLNVKVTLEALQCPSCTGLLLQDLSDATPRQLHWVIPYP